MKRLLLLSPLLVLLMAAPTHGQNTNRAGLVVVFGDGSVQTQCVDFAEQNISGYDLLLRGGYDVIAQASGNNAAVCKIEGDGCNFPAEPCFCKSGRSQTDEYWSYWQLDGDEWRYSTRGAGMTRVEHGDVEAWVWGPGERGDDQGLPVVSFDRICTAPEATAAPTTMPPDTPVNTPAADNAPSPMPSVAPTTPGTSSPGSEQTEQTDSSAGYVIFGVLLIASLGAIGLAVLRERR